MPKPSGHCWTASLALVATLVSSVVSAQSPEVGASPGGEAVESVPVSKRVERDFFGWIFSAEDASSADEDGLAASVVRGQTEGWQVVGERVVKRSGPGIEVIEIDGNVRLRSEDDAVVVFGDRASIDVKTGEVRFEAAGGVMPRMMFPGEGWALSADDIRVSLDGANVKLTGIGIPRPS